MPAWRDDATHAKDLANCALEEALNLVQNHQQEAENISGEIKNGAQHNVGPFNETVLITQIVSAQMNKTLHRHDGVLFRQVPLGLGVQLTQRLAQG